jgi:hypothetical protein
MNITIIINTSTIIITIITIKHGPNFNTTIIIITASNFSIAYELFDFLHLGREHATRPRAILAYVNIWNGNIWEIINRKPNTPSASDLTPTSTTPSTEPSGFKSRPVIQKPENWAQMTKGQKRHWNQRKYLPT